MAWFEAAARSVLLRFTVGHYAGYRIETAENHDSIILRGPFQRVLESLGRRFEPRDAAIGTIRYTALAQGGVEKLGGRRPRARQTGYAPMGDFAFQVFDHAGDVLVAHRAKYGIRVRKITHIAEILR